MALISQMELLRSSDPVIELFYSRHFHCTTVCQREVTVFVLIVPLSLLGAFSMLQPESFLTLLICLSYVKQTLHLEAEHFELTFRECLQRLK